jgi:undecaprenyl diphosphate synthase
MMSLENKIAELEAKVKLERIPDHIAIIMDGNGRWAVERDLPRHEGHLQGVETVREAVKNCNELGIKVLTLFAFSTENWQRPAWEVNYLMSLPQKYFQTELPQLIKNNVQVRMIGKQEKLPKKVLKVIAEGAAATKNNSGMVLNFALNYGSRSEILTAVNKLIEEASQGNIKRKITEAGFSKYLYTKDLPDPDLLIRTSGEIRISNFLLWQLAYSELWFTDVYWPDFNKLNLLEAIEAFQQRKRRFGKV